MRSSVTSVLSGAPSSFQFGINSVSARGSITAPDRMCAPSSPPFSSTQTDDFLALFGGQLLEADRRRQAGGAAADDDDVVFHRFAWTVLFENIDWLCHGFVMG